MAARLTPLRPQLSRKVGSPLRVEPCSARYTLVGTAFDYLLRFELQRRAPYAVAKEWVAERAPELLFFRSGRGSGSSVDNAALVAFDPEREYDPLGIAEELSDRAKHVLSGAKAAIAAYIKEVAPTPTMQQEVAGHALRLARLDSISRILHLDLPTFEDGAPEDVQDLLAMLDLVPFIRHYRE